MFDEKKFKAQMVLADMTFQDLAKILECDPSTIWRKMKTGGAFTRDEINKLIDAMKIEDPISIFFAPEFAETQN